MCGQRGLSSFNETGTPFFTRPQREWQLYQDLPLPRLVLNYGTSFSDSSCLESAWITRTRLAVLRYERISGQSTKELLWTLDLSEVASTVPFQCSFRGKTAVVLRPS
jgi:hypothetical protein